MSTPAGRSVGLALVPSAAGLATGVLALVLAALGAGTNAVEYCLLGLYVALVLAVCSILTIAYLPGRDKLLWCALTLVLALLGIAIGVAIWSQAIGVACHHGATCPFN